MYGAVILAGGSGERLFPYSSEQYPKQFLSLTGKRSMLQETYARLRRHFPAGDIYIVTQQAFQDTVYHQLPSVTGEHVIVEPARRDTAGAIALALAKLKDMYDVILVCPADHHIQAGDEWDSAVQTALRWAQSERQITLFGIVPNYPETGFGYVEYKKSDGPVCPVVRFHEKPDRDLALQMVRSGNYLWNCGIFAIPCDTGLEAFREHLPAHACPGRRSSPVGATAVPFPRTGRPGGPNSGPCDRAPPITPPVMTVESTSEATASCRCSPFCSRPAPGFHGRPRGYRTRRTGTPRASGRTRWSSGRSAT
ncbi:MAG: NTP transferase domain-containing protein [Alicyclobacillus sp.]|nr:NTP transferase domain-containing protein [Alicyclobacillus sp.]